MSAKQLILSLSKRHFHWMVLSVVLGFSGALFNGIGTALVIPLVLRLLGQDIATKGNFPPLLKSAFSVFDSFSEQHRALLMIACVVLLLALKNLANYLNAVVSGIVGRKFNVDLRKQMYSLLLEVDYTYYARTKLGDLLSYIGNEANRTAAAVRTLISIASAVITILVFLAILISLSWKLTILSTFLLGVVALVNQSAIKKSKVFGQELSESARALTNYGLEVLSGIRLVKSTATESQEYDELEKLIHARERAQFKSQLVSASIGPVNELSSVFSLVILVLVGRVFISGQLQTLAPIILTYLLVLFRLLPVVGQLNSARGRLANNLAGAEIIAELLRRDNKPFMHSGSRPFTGLQSGIRFSNLSFKYPGYDRLVLQNVNLELPKGTTLALVGPSGAGKSTLADLLPRFYDPIEGSIIIDGIDLREIDIKSFRKRVGIVSQETFLFNKSVRDNIAYGHSWASDRDVELAAKRANAYEFIQNLPYGFDTLIGDRGVMLSGGQRQRLAIARALMQDPEILILDEATSALDTISENLVQQALTELSQDRTTLVIAHRLSTVQDADQIAVLEQGQVVEVGTHKELLAKGRHYAELYEMQFSDEFSPKDEDADNAVPQLKSLNQFSFEVRSRLSGMLGVLELLSEGMIEDSAEHEELTNNAYESALRMLQVIEEFEKTVDPESSQQSTYSL